MRVVTSLPGHVEAKYTWAAELDGYYYPPQVWGNRVRLYPGESGLVEIYVEDMDAIEHWPIAFEARDWCGGTRRWFEVKVRAEPRLASGEGPMFEVEVLNPRFDGDRGWRARMQAKGVP